MKLKGKVIISGKIVAETGLHIGGSKSSLDIGGVDLNVIKTPQGHPFIPGSSLKGKLRSLLARTEGSLAVNKREVRSNELSDEDFPYIMQIFGSSGDDKNKGEVTRILVRDAHLDDIGFDVKFKDAELELGFSDVKWENTIDRKRGTAQHPRQLERVPAGAAFDFEIVYDLYNDTDSDYKGKNDEPEQNDGVNVSTLKKHLQSIEKAMRLLQDDYLGGQGSRGYGKVSFIQTKVVQKNISTTGTYDVVELEGTIKKFADNLQSL